MFNVANNDSEDEHEYCDGNCGCTDEEEAYLDQVATRNYEEDASNEKVDDPEELLRYTSLKGINIPIKMLGESEAVSINTGEQAGMGAECPLPPVVVETMV
jgi:hypothetical protein